MNRRYLIAASLLLMLAPTVVQAQQSAAEKEVYAVVETFFKGFNGKDTTAMRAMLFDDVKLLTSMTNREGVPVARSEAVAQMMTSIASAPVKLNEKIFDPIVQVEDGLASVWVRYEFYADEKYSHCGVDAFLLVKTTQGWKIAALADTRKKSCAAK